MIGIESPLAFDEELRARVKTVLRWEVEHESLLQTAANDWTRAERTFAEVIEGMGQFLPAHHRMVEEMLADDGTRRPLAHEGWTWRAVSTCGCCLSGHLYAAGSKACGFATGGFGDDRCEVGSLMWRELLRQVGETPGCPDPKVWARIVAEVHRLPEPEEPGPLPPDRPWLLSLLLPPAPLRTAASGDTSWLPAFQVATAWLWGLHVLTAP